VGGADQKPAHIGYEVLGTRTRTQLAVPVISQASRQASVAVIAGRYKGAV
jgi:hypothetical protein